MKHLLICRLALVCLLFPVVTSAVNREVKYPTYTLRNTETLEIEKIVVTDTATVLSVDAYSRPNYWVALSSRTILKGKETGKTYRLLRSDGFALDSRVVMPESGNVSFTLYFEPLDSEEQQLDFIEGESPNDFRIEGLSFTPPSQGNKIDTHLKGVLVDRPQTNRLMILASGKDPRTSSWVSIPVREGKFDYHFYTNEEKAYSLICWDDFLSGSMPNCVFFSESGTVDFTLYPSEHNPFCEIKTINPLTQEYQNFRQLEKKTFLSETEAQNKRYEQLEADSCFYTKAYNDFWKRFEKETDSFKRDKLFAERDSLEATDAFYTPQAIQWKKEYRELDSRINKWRWAYFDAHPSVVGLYWIQQSVCYNPEKEGAEKLFISRYESLFPNHSSAKEIRMMIDGLKLLPGAKYLEVTAPDLQGREVNVNTYIRGKVALVDLWASWCGPCRRRAIGMIPVYEKYKEKGFTIIGIAREQGSSAAMEAAIRKDGYPWLNLIELNDKNYIWMRHHLSNAAGGTFLIDKDGTILAVDPEPEEVERILQTKL